MTNNNKCAGECINGTVWVDAYHGQKKVSILSNTASKVALLNDFNVNLANCCVPVLNGGVDDFLDIIVPDSDIYPSTPTKLDLYPDSPISNTVAWTGATFATDVANATTSLGPINCCTQFKVALKDNTSSATISKFKIEFSDNDSATPTTVVGTVNFEFPFPTTPINGLQHDTMLTSGSKSWFVYGNCLIQVILPSFIFSGTIATPNAASVSFVDTIGIQCTSFKGSLRNFITCNKNETCDI